jgi:hypothetical protein
MVKRLSEVLEVMKSLAEAAPVHALMLTDEWRIARHGHVGAPPQRFYGHCRRIGPSRSMIEPATHW